MKRMRIVGLCLVAVFAFTAIAASSAFAEPSGEFGFCVKKTGGKYENSGCTKEKAGATKFEWEPLTTPVGLSGKMKEGTLATLETVKGTKITCKKEHNTGEIATAHEVANVVATFEECETSKIPCHNEGTSTIKTNPLSGGTGVEKKGTTPPSNNKMAEELHGPGGGALAEFECSGLKVVVTGSVLHPVASGKMLTKTTEKFSATKGEQKPSNYEGEPDDSHALASSTNGGTPEESGQTITAEVTFAKAVELNPIK